MEKTMLQNKFYANLLSILIGWKFLVANQNA